MTPGSQKLQHTHGLLSEGLKLDMFTPRLIRVMVMYSKHRSGTAPAGLKVPHKALISMCLTGRHDRIFVCHIGSQV